MLRYASQSEATVWVETDAACEVEILGRKARTFFAEGHHFALVVLRELPPGSSVPYEVALDGERRWPPPDAELPPSRLRTLGTDRATVVFGSCRVTAPHRPPYTLSPDEDELGFGVDALYALALRMREQDPKEWPDLLLMIGDQVYADEVSPETEEFIRTRRDPGVPPGEEVADFEEYARLYREAWGEPTLRWLLSTVPSAMIFDDHDVHDDWNTSAAWVEEMRGRPWWHERITSALATYWIYQHIGNFSPAELEEDEVYRRVLAAADAGPALREFASAAEAEGGGSLWSFSREIAGSLVVVLDGREGRVLSDGRRQMVDEDEWSWIEERFGGDFDHLLIANTLPVLLAPSLHYLEAWDEAVAEGAWGRPAAWLGERLRQALDLEHWAAFQDSFARLIELVRQVAAGERGRPPASIVFLGGDVHQAYLHEAAFPAGTEATSAVYQATCSPFRNPLDRRERAVIGLGHRSRLLARSLRALARAAGVADPLIDWRLVQEPTFDNQLGLIELDGRGARLRIERTTPGDAGDPGLEVSLARVLA